MTSPSTMTRPEHPSVDQQSTQRPLLFRRRREGRRYSPPKPTVDGEKFSRSDLYDLINRADFFRGTNSDRDYLSIKVRVVETLAVSPAKYSQLCCWASDFVFARELPDRGRR